VELYRYLGTAPFVFGEVILLPRGKYEYERMTEKKAVPQTTEAKIFRPPAPVGSPYGFNDEDWEFVAKVKGTPEQLHRIFLDKHGQIIGTAAVNLLTPIMKTNYSGWLNVRLVRKEGEKCQTNTEAMQTIWNG